MPPQESEMQLSTEDQLCLASLLLNPPEPSPALKRAREAHGRLLCSLPDTDPGIGGTRNRR